MTSDFTPSFRDLQKDIERYLEGQGKCEKNEHGQSVYRGYPDALSWMFRQYIEKRAFGPMVAEMRKWNWELSYSDYLLEVTECLRTSGDWPLLKALWAAVIAKRRTSYNKTKKMQRALPGEIPEELVTKTRALLLESLYQLQRYASELQQESDMGKYVEMIARVERRIKA